MMQETGEESRVFPASCHESDILQQTCFMVMTLLYIRPVTNADRQALYVNLNDQKLMAKERKILDGTNRR